MRKTRHGLKSSVAESCVDPMIALRSSQWPETDVTAGGGSGLEILRGNINILVGLGNTSNL